MNKHAQDLYVDMWDANRNLLSYLIEVYKRNGITHEEYAQAKMLLRQASKALAKFNGQTGQPTFDKEKNNRGFDRTLKQYSYKVPVLYYTVR